MASKKDEQFWLEQHSWGDFPFDKPAVNVNVNVTNNNINIQEKINQRRCLCKQVRNFVKELCNLDMSEKITRYPLL